MTPPCEANASMAALKKNDEAKFKAVCTGIRTDGAFIEAGALAWPNGLELSADGLHRRLAEAGTLVRKAA